MSFAATMEGADDLVAALLELPKRATEKVVVRRALTKSAEPIRGLWAALAPFDGSDLGLHLRDAVVISTQTKSRQTLDNAKPGDVTMYVGPDKNLPRHHGIFMEFGTFKDPAQPSGRPAWESQKDEALNVLGYWMGVEIDGAARRLAARAARLGI